MAESQYVSNILKNSFDTAAKAIKITANEKDTISDALVTIDITHHEIHDGNHYTKTFVETKLSSQFLNITFKKGVAANAKRHVSFEVGANQSGAVYLYEQIKTSAAGGTTYTLLNNNRTSTKACAYRLITGKTTFSSSTGTLLVSGQYGANLGAQRFGGSANSRNEWVFKSTKEYLLRYDPAANTTGIMVTVTLYEES